MITLSGLAADALGEFLAEDCLKTFGAREEEFAHGVADGGAARDGMPRQ